ncbi:MAG TPA: acetyl-CoA C-acetyltransferase [Candidatus Binatia bacterium]|nr:acetyl-CoA C-acetyltransferase [Candidatus Binatia bacterium]
MAEAVIVSATRTAIGSMGGGLSSLQATQLGAVAIREALKRAGVEGKEIGEVILGNVLAAGLGLNAARVAYLEAGIPKEVPGYGVNKACGSGLKAVALAAAGVLLGEYDVAVAGGMESMSNAPYLLQKARYGYRLGHGELLDSMIADGLSCPITHVHMGITAENVAKKYEIPRDEQDRFAAASQAKAAAALKEGRFRAEIVPVQVPGKKKGETVEFAVDEFPRADTTVEKLAPLRAAFQKDGTVTAGNASGINDGAAALVVMSDAAAKARGLKPLARIRGWASAGVDPSIMGMGPWPASEKLLAKTGTRREDVGLWELNEAFAAQSLGVLRELKIDPEKVNVNGGAIALGHPIGASGARVLVTLLHAMQARDVGLGVASLCIGGGQGIAMLVER